MRTIDRRPLFALPLLALLAVAAAARAEGIPDRPAGALTGRQFIDQTRALSRAAREAAIEREARAGNIPPHQRSWATVTYTQTDAALRPHQVTLWCLPDYLAIGSDTDFVRMPMSPLTAQRIADAYGLMLPTRRMVDRIYAAAQVKLAPVPLTPGPQMMSNAYYLNHQNRIQAQWGARPLGLLAGGLKKDVVISNRLLANPGRVAIYGWHQLNGRPIQPLSTVHENGYADYSHGIRLCWPAVLVDGRAVWAADVLKDATLAPLLSDEGRMASPRIPGA